MTERKHCELCGHATEDPRQGRTLCDCIERMGEEEVAHLREMICGLPDAGRVRQIRALKAHMRDVYLALGRAREIIGSGPNVPKEEVLEFFKNCPALAQAREIKGRFTISHPEDEVWGKHNLVDPIDEAPKDWDKHHAKGCGTAYRGCAPDCPKAIFEHTGRWTGGRSETEADGG